MNQKPSERIEELLKTNHKSIILDNRNRLDAIIQYLDEEWERNNEEHEKNKTPEQRQWDVLSSNL